MAPESSGFAKEGSMASNSLPLSLDRFPEVMSLVLSRIQELQTQIVELKQSLKEEEKLLTTKEARELLQISLGTLSAWTRAGKLKEYRIQSRIYYKRSEIFAALQSLKKFKS